MDLNSLLIGALTELLTELSDGLPGDTAYILNTGDRGLLVALRGLSAVQASARPQGRTSIASHVHHLYYGFTLKNRSLRGEDPYRDANWSESWRHQHVNETEWAALSDNLESEIQRCREAIATPRVWDAVTLTSMIGCVAHMAYHLGAIRQVDAAAAGPPETH